MIESFVEFFFKKTSLSQRTHFMEDFSKHILKRPATGSELNFIIAKLFPEVAMKVVKYMNRKNGIQFRRIDQINRAPARAVKRTPGVSSLFVSV